MKIVEIYSMANKLENCIKIDKRIKRKLFLKEDVFDLPIIVARIIDVKKRFY